MFFHPICKKTVCVDIDLVKLKKMEIMEFSVAGRKKDFIVHTASDFDFFWHFQQMSLRVTYLIAFPKTSLFFFHYNVWRRPYFKLGSFFTSSEIAEMVINLMPQLLVIFRSKLLIYSIKCKCTIA